MDHCLSSIICVRVSPGFLDCGFLIVRVESGSGSGHIFGFFCPSYPKQVDFRWRAFHEGPELSKATAQKSEALSWPPSHTAHSQVHGRYHSSVLVLVHPEPHRDLLTVVLLTQAARLAGKDGSHKQQD